MILSISPAEGNEEKSVRSMNAMPNMTMAMQVSKEVQWRRMCILA